jgi:hypothetical protein
MIKPDTIVGFVGGHCKGEYDEQKGWENAPAASSEIKARIKQHVAALLGFLEKDDDSRRFDEVERGLRDLIFSLARILLAYFLARREETSKSDVSQWLRKGCRRRKPERKHLNTFFGRVTYWRTYVRRPGGTGIHPLDLALGLSADGFSLLVTEICARLSTLVSYEQVTALSLYFLGWSPSKTSVEKAVLGLGLHTQAWFEAAPPPKDDGEVLVIQFDSKATPTATDEELEKRRQKRGKKNRAKGVPSPRHRGRQKRARTTKRRRKKGDKSKNGKAATIVTMYTLKKGRDETGKRVLLGPVNKRVYASYAPKRHAFAFARREADKRGFAVDSGKTVQIVTDGDDDLESYAKEFFPGAKHTLDIIHVKEYIWEAGRFVYAEGSSELAQWVKRQERLLYRGKVAAAIDNVSAIKRLVGPNGRERIRKIEAYLRKRVHLMNYRKMRKEDLEVASGVVEGAVRHVIAKRFDNGSMRWIRERAEALLQLRCIEINGDWSAFMAFAQRRLREKALRDGQNQRLLSMKPGPLPVFGLAS